MRPAGKTELVWRLSGLLEGYARVASEEDLPIRGIATDSRQVKHGDLFLACGGLKTHGMHYAAHALAAGAAAIAYEPQPGVNVTALRVPCIPVAALGRIQGEIAARFFAEPSKSLTVFGVTGTDGKTSVSHFIAQALDEPRARCGLVGTLGCGYPDALVPGTHTTPDAVHLQETFAGMRDAGARAVAMEVSSHALDQERARGVDFDIAVLTNLGRDHLDYHGDIAAYAAAKRKLFALGGLRAAVLNYDDEFGRSLAGVLPQSCQRIVYGEGSAGASCAAWLRATRIEPVARGIRVLLDSSWGNAHIESPLFGRFNGYNLLATLGALLASGLEFNEALKRVARVRPVAGRMEAFGGGEQPLVVVDYAHTPQALANALASLRLHCQGTLWCVFGCGGDRDKGKRPLMGEVAERLADRVILTQDNPRNEPPAQILAQIRLGLRRADLTLEIPDRAQAIAEALARARAGDAVLIAGKGHETVQIVGSRQIPFSDRERVLALL